MDAKTLAGRVMRNMLDPTSPATTPAVVLDSLFDVIAIDKAAATAMVYDAAGIVAAVIEDIKHATPDTLDDVIVAHTT